MGHTILKKTLQALYINKQQSAHDIALETGCSEQKIHYWLRKYKIPKRSISEAIYIKHNPGGDPFSIKDIKTMKDALLFGIGVGLYWGEGTKSNTHAIRLGNTDPRLMRKFIAFLKILYGVREDQLRFGLQVFSDMDPRKALLYWCRELGVTHSQFQKVVVTRARSIGTYRKKSQYGVLTVYYHNKKLRDILCNTINNL